jgi:CBS domain-containing protein
MPEAKRALTVREVMTRVAITLPPTTPIREAAQRMAISRTGCVMVVGEDQRLIGMFTERDLLNMFTTRLDPPLAEPVGDHMSLYPLTLGPDASVAQCRIFMRENMIRHVPIVEHDRLVGIVSMRDLNALLTE